MIPNLAIIVAAYVNFWMIEVFLYSGARYSNKGTRIAAWVFAVLVFLVASPTFEHFSETYLKTVSVHKKSHDRETWLMKNLTEFFGTAKLCKIERKRVLEYRASRLLVREHGDG